MEYAIRLSVDVGRECKIRTPIQISMNHRVPYASEGLRPTASVRACKRARLGPYYVRVCVRVGARARVCVFVCACACVCVCATCRVHSLIPLDVICVMMFLCV